MILYHLNDFEFDIYIIIYNESASILWGLYTHVCDLMYNVFFWLHTNKHYLKNIFLFGHFNWHWCNTMIFHVYMMIFQNAFEASLH